MNNVLSLVRKPVILSAALVVLLLLPTRDVMADDSYCDARLGRNYDEQTAEVKRARSNLYWDCSESQGVRFLQTLHKDILTETQKWQNRANQVIRSSLTTKRNTMEAEIRVAHRMERDELEADYRSKYAAIEATRDGDNTAEITAKRRETTDAHRSDRATMTSRQNLDAHSMRRTFTQCSVLSNNQIKQMINVEHQSISQQFLEKVAWWKRKHRELKETPMTMSPNDFAAQREKNRGSSIGKIDEIEGKGTILKEDGSKVELLPGTPVELGDVVIMDEGSRCNIIFADNTQMTLEGGSRTVIDEYAYYPDRDENKRDFSILKWIYLFTSRLIGYKEVQDVEVLYGHEIGIRG